jgi:hypothetical protein
MPPDAAGGASRRRPAPGRMRDNGSSVPDWLPPFPVASLAILLLNLALLGQRRRERRNRWDWRLLRELRSWDGRLSEDDLPPKPLR